jgi:ubiquinone/menaquinone biosynthesis C-methylase UbiE
MKVISTLESTLIFNSKPVKYIPALSFNSFTRFFDSLQKWGVREEMIKPRLIMQTGIQSNFKVLDLGCGTGTLTLLIKNSQPSAEVIGIDIDPNVLDIAKKKASLVRADISFDLGTAFNLPYPDNFFDRVVSSLVFHHLTRENKVRALVEVLRILKTSGELHIADIGRPQNILMRLPSAVMRRLEETEDNVIGMLPQMLKISGFDQVEETIKIMTMFGTVSFYKGLKPSKNN